MADQSYLCAIGRMERVNPRRPDGLGETRGWLVLIGLCGLLVPLRLAVLIKLLGPFVRLGLARFLSTPLDSSNPSNSSNNTNNTNNTNPLELLQLLQLLQLLELLVIFRKHSF